MVSARLAACLLAGIALLSTSAYGWDQKESRETFDKHLQQIRAMNLDYWQSDQLVDVFKNYARFHKAVVAGTLPPRFAFQCKVPGHDAGLGNQIFSLNFNILWAMLHYRAIALCEQPMTISSGTLSWILPQMLRVVHHDIDWSMAAIVRQSKANPTQPAVYVHPYEMAAAGDRMDNIPVIINKEYEWSVDELLKTPRAASLRRLLRTVQQEADEETNRFRREHPHAWLLGRVMNDFWHVDPDIVTRYVSDIDKLQTSQHTVAVHVRCFGLKGDWHGVPCDEEGHAVANITAAAVDAAAEHQSTLLLATDSPKVRQLFSDLVPGEFHDDKRIIVLPSTVHTAVAEKSGSKDQEAMFAETLAQWWALGNADDVVLRWGSTFSQTLSMRVMRPPVACGSTLGEKNGCARLWTPVSATTDLEQLDCLKSMHLKPPSVKQTLRDLADSDVELLKRMGA